eukprot:TRINITY_DN15531_c0_g1_i4.p1 TRINITY_DN15531_c0_g1~~TRINITY_DN15531_c0_g1_i4.p1  ORF type:complete len:783 (-),score=74.03 TRINITY_DN15531_c0_g1_i4:272-2620(-)
MLRLICQDADVTRVVQCPLSLALALGILCYVVVGAYEFLNCDLFDGFSMLATVLVLATFWLQSRVAPSRTFRLLWSCVLVLVTAFMLFEAWNPRVIRHLCGVKRQSTRLDADLNEVLPEHWDHLVHLQAVLLCAIAFLAIFSSYKWHEPAACYRRFVRMINMCWLAQALLLLRAVAGSLSVSNSTFESVTKLQATVGATINFLVWVCVVQLFACLGNSKYFSWQGVWKLMITVGLAGATCSTLAFFSTGLLHYVTLAASLVGCDALLLRGVYVADRILSRHRDVVQKYGTAASGFAKAQAGCLNSKLKASRIMFWTMSLSVFVRLQLAAVWRFSRSVDPDGFQAMTLVLEPIGGIDTCIQAFGLAVLGGILDLSCHRKGRKHQRLGQIKGCKCCRGCMGRCHCCKCMQRQSLCHARCPSCAWQDQVASLANRTLTVAELLAFYSSLGTQMMPHFDPARSTTNDVVRQAIIPLSGGMGAEDGGPQCCVHSMKSEGLRAGTISSNSCTMVTHDWENRFCHLVAAVVAHFCQATCWQDIAAQLSQQVPERQEAIQDLERQLQQHGNLNSKIWICAFCVNQHASICGGFGPQPDRNTEPSRYNEWMRKRRDTVTGQEHPICDCNVPKYWNDSPVPCEMNKFDAMMAVLAKRYPDFTQLVAMDEEFGLLTRAWCIAELAEADRLRIRQRILIHSQGSLQKALQEVEQIRVQDCKASREQDKHDIIQRIGDAKDLEAFNAQIQRLLLGASGLLTDISDQHAAYRTMASVLSHAWDLADSQTGQVHTEL